MSVAELVCAYSKCDRLEGDVEVKIGDRVVTVPRPYDREKFKEFQIC